MDHLKERELVDLPLRNTPDVVVGGIRSLRGKGGVRRTLDSVVLEGVITRTCLMVDVLTELDI